jgi:hypothetical protein
MPESLQLSPLSAVPAEVDAALGTFFRDRHADYDAIDPVVGGKGSQTLGSSDARRSRSNGNVPSPGS